MTKTTVLLAAFFVTGCMSAGALELSSNKFELGVEALKSGGIEYLESSDFLAQEETFDIDAGSDKSIYEYEYKSPKKAFIYSLLLPGLGQRYAGSSILKTAFYLAVEAGSWGGHFKYHGDGNDKTDEFKAFANAHWFEGDTTGADHGVDPPVYPNLDEETYRNWLLINYGTVAETEIEEPGFTETLPNTKTQQYYEMIGKYDQFIGGWDDYWDGDPESTTTPNRTRYLSMREKANDLLDKANLLMIVAMANHLLSAFDAAISANRHNKKAADDTWTIKAELKRYSAVERIPMLTVTHRF